MLIGVWVVDRIRLRPFQCAAESVQDCALRQGAATICETLGIGRAALYRYLAESHEG